MPCLCRFQISFREFYVSYLYIHIRHEDKLNVQEHSSLSFVRVHVSPQWQAARAQHSVFRDKVMNENVKWMIYHVKPK